MSRQCVPSGYANLRIEYHANAVNVVCMKLKKRTPSSAAVEIDLIVSHTSENQPRMSQPSRSANAAITTTIASHVSQRRQAGRRAVDGGTAVASVAVAVGLDIRWRRPDRACADDAGRHPERMMMRAKAEPDTAHA